MKRLFSILLLATLFSCQAPDGERVRADGFNYITIDSCEYIEVDYGVAERRVYSLTHKGNCKNHKQ